MFYYQTFLLLEICSLLDCSQQIPVKRIGDHRVKGGHGFEITVRMENLRGGDWDEKQNSAHRVRSMHSRSSLFSVIFYVFDISTTEGLTQKEYNKYQGILLNKNKILLFFQKICCFSGSVDNFNYWKCVSYHALNFNLEPLNEVENMSVPVGGFRRDIFSTTSWGRKGFLI